MAENREQIPEVQGHPGRLLSVAFFGVCAVTTTAWMALLIWLVARLL
jgi:hypothetical protein